MDVREARVSARGPEWRSFPRAWNSASTRRGVWSRNCRQCPSCGHILCLNSDKKSELRASGPSRVDAAPVRPGVAPLPVRGIGEGTPHRLLDSVRSVVPDESRTPERRRGAPGVPAPTGTAPDSATNWTASDQPRGRSCKRQEDDQQNPHDLGQVPNTAFIGRDDIYQTEHPQQHHEQAEVRHWCCPPRLKPPGWLRRAS
jgi:hypothetical protein